MADEGGGNPNFIGMMFSSFPIFTIIMMMVIVYVVWRSTGGIERGEARRAAGDSGVFLQVTGVPEQFGSEELFGSVQKETLQDLGVVSEDDETDQ